MTLLRSVMPTESVPFKVADLSLADFGRKEIRLAEHEMPGLMAVREEYAKAQPLRRIDSEAGWRAWTSVWVPRGSRPRR